MQGKVVLILCVTLSSVSSYNLPLNSPKSAVRTYYGNTHIRSTGFRFLRSAPRLRNPQGFALKCSSKPRPGDLTASELVKYLWNDLQFDPEFPAPSLEFFSDDIVYEDMIYPKPFVGKEQVKSFLLNTKKQAPDDFVFIIDKCSDGVKSCGFTWHIELKTRPDAGKFAFGCSFYELNDEGKVCYIRDIPEPPIKIGTFGLVLANLAAKAIKSRPPPSS